MQLSKERLKHMFSNTTILTDGTNSDPTTILVGPENGKTIRKSVAGVTLTIGSQPSNENGGTPSSRSAISLELKKPDANGKLVTSYVRLIIMTPSQETAIISDAEVQTLTAQLVNFLVQMDQDASTLAANIGAGNFVTPGSLPAVPRLRVGEP